MTKPYVLGETVSRAARKSTFGDADGLESRDAQAMAASAGPHGLRWSLDQHHVWLDAVRSSDEERALGEVEQHISGTAETILALLAGGPVRRERGDG